MDVFTGIDKTLLWAVLGVFFAFCCWPLGLVFAILSLLEAKKRGNPPTLAVAAFAVLAVVLVIKIWF